MKILFYSDLHVREFGSFPNYNYIQSSGFTKELINSRLSFQFIENKISEIEPDLVIGLGDDHHLTEGVPTRTLFISSEGNNKINAICKKLGIQHLKIVGNHDIISEIDGTKLIHSIAGFQHSNTKIIDSSESFDLNGFRIFLFPYYTDKKVIYENFVDASSYDMVCTHLEFSGFEYENGTPCSGLRCDLKIPVVSGHLHKPQQVKNIIYPGSIIQQRFYTNNINHVGGVLIYDTDTEKYHSFPNDLSKHYVKIKSSKELSKLDPEKCVIYIQTQEDLEDIKSLLTSFEFFYSKFSTGHTGEITTTYEDNKIDNPEDILRNHLNDIRPDSVHLFDEVIKEK